MVLEPLEGEGGLGILLLLPPRRTSDDRSQNIGERPIGLQHRGRVSNDVYNPLGFTQGYPDGDTTGGSWTHKTRRGIPHVSR